MREQARGYTKRGGQARRLNLGTRGRRYASARGLGFSMLEVED